MLYNDSMLLKQQCVVVCRNYVKIIKISCIQTFLTPKFLRVESGGKSVCRHEIEFEEFWLLQMFGSSRLQ